MNEKFYDAAEDSELLLQTTLKQLSNFSHPNSSLSICEVGVGSGYVLSSIAKKYSKNNYYGCDINEEAIKNTKKLFSKIEINSTIKKSNLLNSFNKKFDVILFNAPYLPLEDGETMDDLEMVDKALYGGPKGYEIIEELIYQINDKLNNDGFCVFVFSSLSHFDYIKKLLDLNCFEYELLDEKYVFFETIYSLKISKSNLLKSLSTNNVVSIKYFSSGKHSKVLLGSYEKKQAIIKYGKFQHLQKEQIFLDKLKEEDFVPKIFFYEDTFEI